MSFFKNSILGRTAILSALAVTVVGLVGTSTSAARDFRQMTCTYSVELEDGSTESMTWYCPAGTKCCVSTDSTGSRYGHCAQIDQPC